MIEFYTLDDELWYIKDGKNEKLEQDNIEMIAYMTSVIREHYKEAYDKLAEHYKKSAINVPYYQFLIVRRFCKCNFGNLDTQKIDVLDMVFNFEKVKCPLRGECHLEGHVCMPKFNSSLSKSELMVMKEIYYGKSVDETAICLCLSPNTVKNHIKSVYAKLRIHERSEFVRYATENALFDE